MNEGGREQDAGGDLLPSGFRRDVHRERGTGEPEHHDREEARGVHASLTEHAFAAQEVVDVVDAGHIEPEHGVERVVQARRDQEAVEEAVDAGAERAEADDPFAEGDKGAVDDGPDDEQDRREHDRHACGDDRNGALAGEEGEPVGQLRLGEAAV
jgi:hypothetical protein